VDLCILQGIDEKSPGAVPEPRDGLRQDDGERVGDRRERWTATDGTT
jgi:hypothetical protein